MINAVVGQIVDAAKPTEGIEEVEVLADVSFKCAWRGKRSSFKRHPMRYCDVVATDAQVSLVGFRSGSTSEKKSEGEEAVDLGLSSQATGVMATISSITNNSASREGSREAGKWYADPAHPLSSDLPLSEKAELSSLPVITPSGLHQTTLATSAGRPDPAALSNSVAAVDTASRPLPASPDRKLCRDRPKGTLEYKVGKEDTLEKIAAHFDVTPSELKKLNRLSLHMVFENQVLYIPDPNYVPSESMTPEPASPPQSPVNAKPKFDIPIVKMADKSPVKVPGQTVQVHSPPTSAPPFHHPPAPVSRTLSKDGGVKPTEEEYQERFLKLSAKMISEGFEKLPGTLLVTPNLIMFEPDVTDDRVIEEGTEHYGAVVYMDTVISAAIYQDVSALCYHTRCSSQKDLTEKPEIYHGDGRVRSASTSSILSSSTPSSIMLPRSSSKSISGISPQSVKASSQASTDSRSGDVTVFRLSAPSASPVESMTNGTSSLKYTVREEGDTIEIVMKDLQSEGQVTSEVNNDAREACKDGVTTALSLSSLMNIHNKNSANISTGTAQERHHQGEQRTSAASEPWESEAPAKNDVVDQAGHSQPESIGQSDTALSGRQHESITSLSNDRSCKIGHGLSDASEGERKKVSSSDGLDGSGLLVNRCPEDVVEEILQAVSMGTVQDSSDMLSSEAHTKAGQDERKLTQDTGREGEEMRIGNIVYLPVEENSEGEMVVRSSNHVFVPDATEPSKGLSDTKPRPPPLSSLGVDATDGASTAAPDSARSRASSDSFSPLRSSAQHISNFVNYATGFFRSSNDDRTIVKDVQDIPIMRERSLTAPEAEREKKKDSKVSGARTQPRSECRFMSAVKAEERPELFQNISDLIPPHEDVHKQPALYLHLRVDTEECDRRVMACTPCESYRHQMTKPHYWFSVPRNKGDHLYAFFIHWRPDLYGDDDINPEDQGFVVVDRFDVTEQAGSLPFLDDHFGQLGSSFRKDWEIVSREEMKRRASLAFDLDQCPMPELSENSAILLDEQILELSVKLPPRTVGYRWSLEFSTSLHGFSLNRLYRELYYLESPILLVLQDTEDVVFGAYLTDPPRISDHFYGTGTCQLWTFKQKFQMFGWTGENAYFIKGDESSLSVGACQGVYGLWLDNDLYHGRSQECNTFGNCVLSGHEDFIIKSLEAWAFLTCC